MHWSEAVHIRPLRKLALKRAEKWMLERLEMTDGLGAIYPAMLNAIIALRCLGYSEDDPQVIRARDEFEKLGIEQPANARNARADLPHDALHVARCGIRRRRSSRWARPACRATIRACSRPWTGCSPRRSATRATGP